MIRHFTGGVGLGDVPFRMQTSRDNASWTAIEFPQLVGPIGGFPDRFPCARQQPAAHVVRLASGRLFFAGDFQHFNGRAPAAVTDRGAYVALSAEEGRTWHVRRLMNALPHESHAGIARDPKWWNESASMHGTLGHAVAAQAAGRHQRVDAVLGERTDEGDLDLEARRVLGGRHPLGS